MRFVLPKTLLGSGSAIAISALILGVVTAPTAAVGSVADVRVSATASKAKAPKDAKVAETEAAATAIAAEFDHPVVVEEHTTETSTVTALPDGLLQLRSTVLPERVEQGGEWVDINTDLEPTPAGDFAPVASTVPVEFSGGGSSQLARLKTDDGTWISESIPGFTLPAPVIDGDTATYRNVLPGIHLHATASSTGMSEVLEITDASAARNPALAELRLAIKGATVTEKTHGGAVAKTKSGDSLVSSTPLWWDSASSGSSAEAPAGEVIAQPVEQTISGGAVSLDIAKIVKSKDVTYPLFVDPDWTSSRQAYWYVDSAYPTTSYLNGAQGAASLNVGYISSAYTGASDGKTHLARAFFKMNTAALSGVIVKDSTFNTLEVWSFNCTPSIVQLYRTSTVNVPGETWNQWKSHTGGFLELQQSKNVAYGNNSGCPANTVGFNTTDAATYAAESGADSVIFGMKAGDETASSGWKRFSPSVELVVTYNRYPYTPATPAIDSPSRVCGTTDATAITVNNAVQNTVISADFQDRTTTDNLAPIFTVRDETAATNLAASTVTVASGYQDQGRLKGTIAAGKLTSGNLYSWTSVGKDSWGDVSQTPSTRCYFRVDNVAPAALPVIESPATGIVGKPLSVRFTAHKDDAIAGFFYWWSKETLASPPSVPGGVGNGSGELANVFANELPACNSGVTSVKFTCVIGVDQSDADRVTSATITTAPIDTQSTLWVTSYDRAGNIVSVDGVSSSGQPIDASSDTTGVSFATGHAWLTEPLLTAPTTPVSDRHTGSSPISLRVMPLSPVEPISGLVALKLYKNASGNYFTATSATPPAGFTFVRTIAHVTPNTGQAKPDGARSLCPSIANVGNHITAPGSQDCEVGNPIGFLFTTLNASNARSQVGLSRCTLGDAPNVVSYWVTNQACEPGYYRQFFGYATQAVGQKTSAAVIPAGSFTVSALLTPTIPAPTTGGWTAISGTSAEGAFRLGTTATGEWEFCLASTCTQTSVIAEMGDPVYVSAIRDTVNKEIRITLGPTAKPMAQTHLPVGTATTPSVLSIWAPVGESSMGQDWRGLLTNPSVFPGVTSTEQLGQLKSGSAPQ